MGLDMQNQDIVLSYGFYSLKTSHLTLCIHFAALHDTTSIPNLFIASHGKATNSFLNILYLTRKGQVLKFNLNDRLGLQSK